MGRVRDGRRTSSSQSGRGASHANDRRRSESESRQSFRFHSRLDEIHPLAGFSRRGGGEAVPEQRALRSGLALHEPDHGRATEERAGKRVIEEGTETARRAEAGVGNPGNTHASRSETEGLGKRSRRLRQHGRNRIRLAGQHQTKVPARLRLAATLDTLAAEHALELGDDRFRREADGARIFPDEATRENTRRPVGDVTTLQACQQRGFDFRGGGDRLERDLLLFPLFPQPASELTRRYRDRSIWFVINHCALTAPRSRRRCRRPSARTTHRKSARPIVSSPASSIIS